MSEIVIPGFVTNLIVEGGGGWAAVRATGTATNQEPGQTGTVEAAHVSTPSWEIARSIMQFDTSALAGVPIASLAVELFVRYPTDPRDVICHILDKGTVAGSYPFAFDQFGNVGSNSYGSIHVVTNQYPDGTWVRIPLDPSATDNLNLSGNSIFTAREAHDLNDVEPPADDVNTPFRLFWVQDDNSTCCRLIATLASSGACLSPRPRLPVEFRPAIGLSSTHDSFDGTAILNLCVGDPGVGGDCGNLIKCDVRHFPDLTAQWLPREGASKVTPNQALRSGFGIRPAWELSIIVGTSRLGFLAPNAPARPEVNDGSFWHLMSILGESQSDVDLEPPALFAPYLYFTPNYQTFKEQWFPVGIDPANSTIGPPSFVTNAERLSIQEMTIRLVARETYLRCIPAYFPSINVCEVPGITITALPPLVAALGGFTTTATLSAPLPTLTGQGEEYGLMDGMLVNLAGTLYGWKLFTITALSSDRQTVTLFSATNLSGAFLIGPAPPAEFRSVIENTQLFLPTYALRGFPKQTPPKRGPQLPLPGAFLLGAENPDED